MSIYKKIMKVFVNLITTGRIIFSFILLSLINNIDQTLFLFLLMIIFLSDFLDGFLARKFKVQTLYGSIMDTIADKVLCIILMIPLFIKFKFILLVIIGELSIALLNFNGKIKGKHTCSSRIGKLKMWILSIFIIFGYVCKFGYFVSDILLVGCLFVLGLQMYVAYEYYVYLKRQKTVNLFDEYDWKNYKKIFYILFDTDFFVNRVQFKD